MRALTSDALRDYDGPAQLPRYDRDAVSIGVVHLGVGAFHRAHQAAYFDDILSKESCWGILGASLRRPDIVQALEPQDGLFTLAERGPEGVSARVIGALKRVVDASRERHGLVGAIAEPTIHLVTVTVTEKGYGLRADGTLDRSDAQVLSDLAVPGGTSSVPGLIAAGLAARRQAGAGPITVLSCDNLRDNGRLLQAAVTDIAATWDRDLVKWIADHVAFPCAMVDRITPATTPEDRVEVAALTGMRDAWPVVTEPFRQWVIEDRFAGPKPPLDRAGASFVSDVSPYETMKLWMLNGAHSTMAYLGQLMGHTYVAEAVADTDLARLLARTALFEVAPGLSISGHEAEGYWRALETRFANPALRHALAQIAMDGSQKVPVRLIAPLITAQNAGRRAPGLELASAAWLVWAVRSIEAGQLPDDPRASDLATALGSDEEWTVRLRALAAQGLLGEIATESPLLDRIARLATTIQTTGAYDVVRRALAPS